MNRSKTLDALVFLRDQAATADDLLTQVIANLTAEQAVWKAPGSTANPAGVTLVHLYHTEDSTVGRFSGQPTVWQSGGWAERIGVDPAAIWTSAPRFDPDLLRGYATEVRAATRGYLDAADPSVLDQTFETPRGQRTVASSLSLLLIIHKMTHAGEIAASLGNQGVKGFPF